MHAPSRSLADTLQQVRRHRRLSQLELSMRLGISQRHLSFVESGRARPSRELLLSWLEALEAPLAVRNDVMLLAGFAPVYGAAALGDPVLAQANDALAQLLRAHDPMPALVIDAQWNIVRMNEGAKWLAATLMPWAGSMLGTAPLNMLDGLANPEGFLARVVNLREVAPAMLAHLRQEALSHPALAPKVDAVAAVVTARLGGAMPRTDALPRAAPVLTTRYETGFGELAFFSMFTTFGTPQDITLASLRVEHMFAADERTRAVVEGALR